MRNFAFIICLLIGFQNFAQNHTEWVKRHFESPFYETQFTGFYLYDPETKEVLENYNGEKLFTPASNVKILTLFSALKVLPDSIPALKYERKGGDLYIQGMGDPTFLHPDFKNERKALEFLKKETGKIYLSWGNYDDYRMGPGWSWEDYEKYYSAERSELPIYGNVAVVKKGKGKPGAFPPTLADSVEYAESLFTRAYHDNKFKIGSRNGSATEVPFVTKGELIRAMLSDALGKEVILSDYKLPKSAKTLFSLPTDKVLKRMMEVSDNFLAEQIMVLVSSQVSNTLNSEKAIQYILNKYLKDLPQKPVWVDGSGLSRYNLFSPRDLVVVLDKLYKDYPRERLFNLFAVGGRTGTLKNNYGGKTPYVYAKSGTLSNNYCLSGYLITKSGKTLIFSVMNNHHQKANWQIRQETQKLLEFIRDNY